MRKIIRSSAAIAVIATLAAVGCQKADPIVGNWVADTDSMGMKAHVELGFESGGKVTQSTDVKSERANFTIKTTGKWSWEEGKKLKVTFETADVDSSNAQIKTMLESGKAQMLEQMNKGTAEEVVWNGNDSFTMNASGQKTTFTRKK